MPRRSLAPHAHALQERLADLWQVPAESVDQELVAARLPQEEGAASCVPSSRWPRRRAMRARAQVSQALQEWQRRILMQMDKLEAVARLKMGRVMIVSAALLGAGVAHADTESLIQARQAAASGDYTQAVTRYQQALDRNGFSAPVLFNLGNAWLRPRKTGPCDSELRAGAGAGTGQQSRHRGESGRRRGSAPASRRWPRARGNPPRVISASTPTRGRGLPQSGCCVRAWCCCA